jgi:hypothetical protein
MAKKKGIQFPYNPKENLGYLKNGLLSDADHSVFHLICSYSWKIDDEDRNPCTASNTTLAEDIGKSRSAISRSIMKMIELKILKASYLIAKSKGNLVKVSYQKYRKLPGYSNKKILKRFLTPRNFSEFEKLTSQKQIKKLSKKKVKKVSGATVLQLRK